MRNAELCESEAGNKIVGRNINTSDKQMIMTRKQRGTKDPLDEGERGE